MTEKQFFEQWNRLYDDGSYNIPQRIDWREVRYMLAYRKRQELRSLTPYDFVCWCAKNYWIFNQEFWAAQTKMLEELEQMAAAKQLAVK